MVLDRCFVVPVRDFDDIPSPIDGDRMTNFSTMHLPLMDVRMFSIGTLRPIDHMNVCRMLALQLDQVVWAYDRHDVDIRVMQGHRNIVLAVHTVMVAKTHSLEVERTASVVIGVAWFACNQLHMLRQRLQLNCNDRSDGHYGHDSYMVGSTVCNLHGY